MTEKKSNTRKQPLTCLSDPDIVDNFTRKKNDSLELSLPIKKRKCVKNGKENQKNKISSIVAESPKNENQEMPSKADSDSDWDMDDIWQSLKKVGVKTDAKSKVAANKSHKELSSPMVSSKLKESPKKEARKQLFSEDHSTLASRSSSSSKYIANSTPLGGLADHDLSKSSGELSPRISVKKSNRKRAFSEVNMKPDDNISYETPLKLKRQEKSPTDKSKKKSLTPITKDTFPILSNDNDVGDFRRISERTPRRSITKRSSPYITPIKKRKCGTPIRNEVHSTPVGATLKKCETPRTPLQEARVSLHVAAVPKCLPCREIEFQNILNFVENKVMDGVGGCMYISGVPGTGKTATVTQVIHRLQAAAASGDLPAFNYIEINGMRLSDPRQAYVQLYQNIFSQKDRISSDAAHKKLDAYFNKSDSKKITTVLLVDELDLMCTKKQDVVYNLLDWPSKPRSRLVVLTIANTMDMPERKLKGRVNSRLGLTRLTFLPYSHKQLEEIVMARLQGTDAFVPDAVRLATRKVAAVSGDARRALDICRRAAELPADDEPVRIKHIEQAIKEMTNSNIVRLIRSCSEVEKYFLRSVSDVCVRTGLEEVDLLQVVDHLLQLCVLEGIKRPPIPTLLVMCQRLKCFRLLFTNNQRAGLLQRITLNITQDDLHFAFKADV